MKKLLLFCFLVSSNLGFAQQNLVPNPSFEQYSVCPTEFNQMQYCIGWSSASDSNINNQTPDFLHGCSSNPIVSPPVILDAYQQPVSGISYAGIGCYFSSPFPNLNVREYIQADLLDTLLTNTKYYVSFYAILLGATNMVYATNKLGALFTTEKFGQGNFAHPINFAQVHSDSVLADTINWFHFMASFVADSSYRFMTIGNFFDDNITDTLNIGNQFSIASYYLIDDVCVSIDSNLCNISNSIFENSDFDLTIYPNPSNDYFQIKNYSEKGRYFTIYNMIGCFVSKYFIDAKSESNIDCSKWNAGIYFLKTTTQNYKINVLH